MTITEETLSKLEALLTHALPSKELCIICELPLCKDTTDNCPHYTNAVFSREVPPCRPMEVDPIYAAAPALIAMAKSCRAWEGAFSDEIERHNHIIAELQKAEAEITAKQRIIDAQAGMIADLQERLRAADAAVQRALAERLNDWAGDA